MRRAAPARSRWWPTAPRRTTALPATCSSLIARDAGVTTRRRWRTSTARSGSPTSTSPTRRARSWPTGARSSARSSRDIRRASQPAYGELFEQRREALLRAAAIAELLTHPCVVVVRREVAVAVVAQQREHRAALAV